MAKKKEKTGKLTGGDIFISVLIALASALGLFLVALIGGSLLFPESWEGPTAAEASAQPSYHVTLPSSAPRQTAAPTQEPPEEANTPTETQDVDPTQEPSAQTTQQPTAQTPAATPSPTPTQNPGPVVSINPTVPPAQQTTAPTQPGNQGGNSGGDVTTYSRENWVPGTFLGTINSDKYHCGNCTAARRIPSENEVWYSSEDAARAAGRSRCGICWR